MNYLVSPYYPESGGTVIDWVDEGSWVDDDDDFDFTKDDKDDTSI